MVTQTGTLPEYVVGDDTDPEWANKVGRILEILTDAGTAGEFIQKIVTGQGVETFGYGPAPTTVVADYQPPYISTFGADGVTTVFGPIVHGFGTKAPLVAWTEPVGDGQFQVMDGVKWTSSSDGNSISAAFTTQAPTAGSLVTISKGGGADGPQFTFLGSAANETALPASENTLADMWITADTGHRWVYNGTGYVDLDVNGVGNRLFPHLIDTDTGKSDAINAAYLAGSINDGDIITTAGYHQGSDLGGGIYRVVAAATGTDDGGSYIDFTGFQLEAVFRGTVYNVAQFGAKCDNATDDTAAVQATFAMMPETGWPGISTAQIQVPGTCRLTDTVEAFRVSPSVVGVGGTAWGRYDESPGFRWDGVAGEPMLLFTHTQGAHIADLRLSGKDAAQPSALIEFAHPATTTAGNSQNTTVSRCLLGKAAWDAEGGKSDIGILVSGAVECDRIFIQDTEIYGCSDAGIAYDNPQATWGSVTNSHVDGYSVSGSVGIRTEADLLISSTSLNRCGVGIDVTVASNVTVNQVGSEGCVKLIESVGNSKIMFRGGYFELDQVPASTNFIDIPAMGSAGTFIMENVSFRRNIAEPSPAPKAAFGSIATGAGFVKIISSLASSQIGLTITGAGRIYLDFLSMGQTPKKVQRMFKAGDTITLDNYTVTNGLPVRTFDADTVTLAELADVVATLAADASGRSA